MTYWQCRKNSETNRTQQKQHKQPILTDSKNVFTYGFQLIRCLQPNTDVIRNFMAQQKQCKQLILIDSKNTFTCRFQPMQRLQHILMTDSIRKFTYTKHKGSNIKLRILPFIPQQQHMQPNLMTDNRRTLIHN